MSPAERILIALLCLAVIVALFIWVLHSYRRGGLGPPMKMSPLTRAGRERVNRNYAEQGWAKPFDDEGNLLPARERRAPEPD